MSPVPAPAPVPGTTAHPIPVERTRPYLRPAEDLPPVTDSPTALRAACQDLAAGHGPVAVDAERASGFRYGQDAYLIQLRREGTGTVLVDPLGAGDLHPLAKVLEEPEWILHAADQDLPCLAERGLAPRRLFDTELAARLLGREHVGLGAVVEETLGLRLAKDHAAADWSIRPLPESWLVYAALDVELLIPLRQALAQELDSQGKAAWAAQEFEYERTRPARSAKVDPWRKTPKAGRALRNRRSLAVLREMWTAREALAADLDITPSKVLPHRALVTAAIMRPTSRRKLMTLHDFSSRQARLHMETWWQALDRALALPEEELPPLRGPLAPGELTSPRSWARHHTDAARLLDPVRAAVRRRAEELRVPQELLLAPDTQRRLAWDLGEAVAAGQDVDVRAGAVKKRLAAMDARPWQVEQVGPILARTLRRVL